MLVGLRPLIPADLQQDRVEITFRREERLPVDDLVKNESEEIKVRLHRPRRAPIPDLGRYPTERASTNPIPLPRGQPEVEQRHRRPIGGLFDEDMVRFEVGVYESGSMQRVEPGQDLSSDARLARRPAGLGFDRVDADPASFGHRHHEVSVGEFAKPERLDQVGMA